MTDKYYGLEIEPRNNETRLQAYRRTALEQQQEAGFKPLYIIETFGDPDSMAPRVVGKLDDPR